MMVFISKEELHVSAYSGHLHLTILFPGKEKQASSKNNTKCGSTFASCTDL